MDTFGKTIKFKDEEALDRALDQAFSPETIEAVRIEKEKQQIQRKERQEAIRLAIYKLIDEFSHDIKICLQSNAGYLDVKITENGVTKTERVVFSDLLKIICWEYVLIPRPIKPKVDHDISWMIGVSDEKRNNE